MFAAGGTAHALRAPDVSITTPPNCFGSGNGRSGASAPSGLSARVARDEELLEAYRPLLEAHVERARRIRGQERAGCRADAVIPSLAFPANAIPHPPKTEGFRRSSFPQLRREQMEDRTQHVVAGDLRAAQLPEGLLGAFKGELHLRAKASGLTPVGCAVLALLSMLPRPPGHPLGVGIQVSRDSLASMVGCCRRSVSYALSALEKAGLIERFRVLVDVPPWFDGRVERTRADVYAVMFPTPRALDLVRHWGADLKQLRELRGLRAPGPARKLGVRGLVGFLLNRLAVQFRGVARRCAAPARNCTPEALDDDCRREAFRSGRPSIVKNPSALEWHFPSQPLRTEVPGALSESAHDRAVAALTAEIDRCWDAKALIAATAYPALWNIDDEYREGRRRALERHFGPIRRALTQRLLLACRPTAYVGSPFSTRIAAERSLAPGLPLMR